MNVALLVVIGLGSFVLGARTAMWFYTFGFRHLQKSKIDIAIEDCEGDRIAIVMKMPEEHRVLAEKIVEKIREGKA